MRALNTTHDYYPFCDLLHQKWFDKTLQYEDELKELFQEFPGHWQSTKGPQMANM